ncbi:MAG TPA: metallophosphoesterase [Candidatus Limnocylindria bacterium]|jgi:hypothetical protein|nr:metallophosphoesterase [Candidatus Limnocylindria bacterium]
MLKLLVVSDLHFAGPAEQMRRGHEARVIGNPALRLIANTWRQAVWLRDPLAHNHRLGRIIAENPAPDLVVANGDFTVDTAFVGASDDASLESSALALGELRQAYGDRLLTTIGDHDLGKQSLFGGVGGPRVASWHRCLDPLGLAPFWRRELGRYVLLGAASTALALPVFAPELLPAEREEWQAIHEAQLAAVRAAFAALEPGQRVILFVHDPTALPFLWREEAIRSRLGQVEHTVIGHLHTRSILRTAQCLAGIPRIAWAGTTLRRYTSALREARCWREFKVLLCPSPAGIQLLKDGGYLRAELDPQGMEPVRFGLVRLPWD